MRKIPEENKYFHYYNCNPKGYMKPDCVFRALSLFLGIPWEEVARMNGRHYIETGKRLRSEDEIRKHLEREGFRNAPGIDPHGHKSYSTLKDFIDMYAEDNMMYIFINNQHAVCIRNKKVWDTYDSSDMCPGFGFMREDK